MQAEYEFGVERLLDGVEQLVAGRGGAVRPEVRPSGTGDAAAHPTLHALSEEQVRAVHKDAEVRAAVRVRREAETRLREATKRERELLRRAAERATRG
jgi:hypothetical protein